MGLAIDIGIGVVVLVAAVIGLIKGFHNQFTKGLCSFLALCIAIALTVLIAPLVRPLGFYVGWQNSAAGWFSAEYFSAEVHSTEELTAVLEGTPLGILKNMSEQLYSDMQSMQLTTLGQFFGAAIINIIAAFVIWLILYLIIKFALYGVKRLLNKASEVPVLKTIDKIFGFIWAEAMTYLVVVVLILTIGEIVVIKFLPSNIETVRGVIESSHVLSFLHNFNLGSVFAKLMGVDLSVLTPIVA